MDPAEGRSRPRQYANHAEVGYNAFEFVIDFAQAYPGEAEPTVVTGIVMSPAAASSFLDVLRRSVDEYESCFGRVAPQPSDEWAGT